MDAIVVTNDRVLILELKDFQHKLTHNGDIWIHGKRRFRSPVQTLSMKARKVKSFLRENIPGFDYYVDFRVVLTGKAGKENLSDVEKPSVWTLEEAKSIATAAGSRSLLSKTKLHARKACALEQDFERITLNPKMFAPLEADWDGYRIIDEDYVVHPSQIWREHRAEQVSDSRFKALVRIWAFDKLPPGLNSPEKRSFIAGREMRAIGRLHELGSPLVERNAILAPIGDEKSEILTQHFELRRLTSGLTTLDRFLERTSEDLSVEDRITAAATLLEIVAELHAYEIAHRDLGARSVWAASPTRIALGGLMSCHIPDEESLGDWFGTLRTHFDQYPEDADRSLSGTAKQRDVYSLGLLAFRILTGNVPLPDAAAAVNILPPELPDLRAWYQRAISQNAKLRHSDGRELADEFGAAVERAQSATGVDQTLIDRHQTTDNPYFIWPLIRVLAGKNIYVGKDQTREIVVKTWPTIRRGAKVECDVAMMRLFDLVGRLVSSPIPGLPRYVRAGLSDVGPFVAYVFEPGRPLIESTVDDPELALALSIQLVQCVDAIHAMGHSHGDIASKNIIVAEDGTGLKLLDVCDLSEVGDGRKRTPAMRPDDWEALTDEQLDRYATTLVVRDFLARTSASAFGNEIEALNIELGRPRLETLEPVAALLRNCLAKFEADRPPRIQIALAEAIPSEFKNDSGYYYLRADRSGPTTSEYTVTGIDRELRFQVRGGDIKGIRYAPVNFTHLAQATQRGVPVKMSIDVIGRGEADLQELYRFIEPIVAPREEPDAVVESTDAASIDVPRYWQKLMEFEGALQPEVEIVREIDPVSGPTAVYVYERKGQDFDFDAGTTVEVRLPNGRKIGEVNLEQTDGQRLVVDYSDRRLMPGDTVFLVDRRSRSSLDRRTKAVDRILEDKAAIPKLIDYFQPSLSLEPVEFGDAIPEATLDTYRLNGGQRRAFKHIIGTGPLGLLQGPPGTGKTHFIASLVHWLTSQMGARKILITSQSHEAVNNAIEALVDLYKRLGGPRPNLLRIGSKGITEKIRPYHTKALQERFQSRFENGFRHRVTSLASAIGLNRAFVGDAIEIERSVGARARRLETLIESERGSARSGVRERSRRDARLRSARTNFATAAERVVGRPIDPDRYREEMDACFATLLDSHPDVSQSDISKVRSLLELSREWSSSLASPYRNFEEFLAKTRTIITATCVGVGQTKIRLERTTFDWVIVDEAARCTPGELAVPIQLGRRVLLVGDHRQLLPMIDRPVLRKLAKEMPDSRREELERSDFERAYLSRYGRENGHTLTEQYRMANSICDLVSKVFYEPHGVRLETSADRETDSAFKRSFGPPLDAFVTWIDTSKEQGHIEQPAPWDDTTFRNEAEAEAVMRLLERIAEDKQLIGDLASGKDETPIGVICMYSAQKARVEELFARRPWDVRFRTMVRIDTVDSYQGKENPIVIVSLVRCNQTGDQGHVRIPNRCNVALSRAKERLYIVGASKMWGKRVPARAPMRKVLEEIESERPGLKVVSSTALR